MKTFQFNFRRCSYSFSLSFFRSATKIDLLHFDMLRRSYIAFIFQILSMTNITLFFFYYYYFMSNLTRTELPDILISNNKLIIQDFFVDLRPHHVSRPARVRSSKLRIVWPCQHLDGLPLWNTRRCKLRDDGSANYNGSEFSIGDPSSICVLYNHLCLNNLRNVLNPSRHPCCRLINETFDH